MESTERLFRRRPQFRLRTMLIVVPIAGALFGYLLRWGLTPVPIEINTTAITTSSEPFQLPPPSDDEVLNALDAVVEDRANVQIIKELVDRHTDDVKVYPLIGPAAVHHAIYRCRVFDKSSTYVVYVDQKHHLLSDRETSDAQR